MRRTLRCSLAALVVCAWGGAGRPLRAADDAAKGNRLDVPFTAVPMLSAPYRPQEMRLPVDAKRLRLSVPVPKRLSELVGGQPGKGNLMMPLALDPARLFQAPPRLHQAPPLGPEFRNLKITSPRPPLPER